MYQLIGLIALLCLLCGAAADKQFDVATACGVVIVVFVWRYGQDMYNKGYDAGSW